MSEDLNKSILLANSKGEGKAYSPEELMSLRINTWKGWDCAAGFDHIQVSPDGNVKAAACKVTGYYGNVYEGPIRFATKWLKCPIDWCMCGTDMRLRKVKDLALLESIEKSIKERARTGRGTDDLPQASEVEWVGPRHWSKFVSHPKSVSWDISKRCNFSCSYCHETISNKTESLRSRDVLFTAVFRIMRGFSKGERIKWIIAGGEPTLHSSYLELCEMLSRKQHIVHTQTNGSRLPSYYRDLIRWSNIGISAHLEFIDVEKVVAVATAIIERKIEDSESSQNWFGVRIMVPPGKYPVALAMSQALEAIPGFKNHGLVFMSMVYEREERDVLMTYEPSEFEKILARS